MIGLTNHAKIIVIKNAGGLQAGQTALPQKPFSITYKPPFNVDLLNRSLPGSNRQFLVDPQRITNVALAAGVAGIAFDQFAGFYHHDLDRELNRDDKIDIRDEVIFVYRPLLILPFRIIRSALANILPSKIGLR